MGNVRYCYGPTLFRTCFYMFLYVCFIINSRFDSCHRWVGHRWVIWWGGWWPGLGKINYGPSIQWRAKDQSCRSITWLSAKLYAVSDPFYISYILHITYSPHSSYPRRTEPGLADSAASQPSRGLVLTLHSMAKKTKITGTHIIVSRNQSMNRILFMRLGSLILKTLIKSFINRTEQIFENCRNGRVLKVEI